MKNKIDNALSKFNEDTAKKSDKNNDNVKKVILDEREGLIERVDRIFIDKSGRQLLREQY